MTIASQGAEWIPSEVPPALFVAGVVLPAAGAGLYWLAGRRGGGWPRLIASYYGAVLAAAAATYTGTNGPDPWPVVTAIYIGLMYAGVAGGLGFALVAVKAFGGGIVGRQRARSDRCRSCGYDLTGNASGVCPECGSGVPGHSDG